MRFLLSLAAPLLLASCTFFAEPTIDELAARVPAYDDATPVNSYVVGDIKTIGELRRALSQGLDPNGCNEKGWYLGGGWNFTDTKGFSEKELMTQRLAYLDVMLKAGGAPQKAERLGSGEERAITYALLIRHGLRADEPLTPTPREVAEGDYRRERYPHISLWELPPCIVDWLMENGAPINETFNGKTLLMDMYASLWEAALLETLSGLREQFRQQGFAMETDAAWERARRMTEYLISRGADLSVKDEQGYCAIDYIPLLGERVKGEGGWTYSDALFERAAGLEQLLLAHGSPQRRAPGNHGEVEALMGCGMMTVTRAEDTLEEREEAQRQRTKAEHDAREARLAPLRAARRAAKEKKKG